ncbi:hypothetical protein Pmani_011839 [Petrolisthes manimaculis]|uniref:Kynureninase n=1 Tax=Petrolisthes manimaculis TaxID=1843537 RepID=A0AAE1UB27_9EUCA|nr:hypothetical protein Pmani_011839 [Petrolisthes manimaculis]
MEAKTQGNTTGLKKPTTAETKANEGGGIRGGEMEKKHYNNYHQNWKAHTPSELLWEKANEQGVDVLSEEFARIMDKEDPLREFRKRFSYPKNGNLDNTDLELCDAEQECIYMCGNSLGLKPHSVDERVKGVIDSWGNKAVGTHFSPPLPAGLCDRYGRELLGKVVGADPSTVVLMNGLTVNLHLLLLSFYQPTPQRYKILIEGHSFPSDRYAMVSQMELRGYKPEEAMLEVYPREGEHTIRTEDILSVIRKEGDSIAVVCLGGVQYYTGQKFDMGTITKAAREAGCMVGWDLAHAVGNVSLHLDDWGVDFACWCTYKYLNSGPGGISGAYVNKRHEGRDTPHLKGWWSNSEDTRFQMKKTCDVAPGVDGFRISNPPPLLVCLVLASLEIFDEAGMDRLVAKQFLLTGYLELLIKAYFGSDQVKSPSAKIITPEDTNQRGCQLSLMFSYPLQKVHSELSKRGVQCDVRKPNVMRIAPAPLYNSFSDVHRFTTILSQVFELCKTEAA